jgi:uncharacterized protein (DUF1800 family)
LGQPLYGKAEPTGYPNTGEGWASTVGLLGRINFASALVEGRVPGVQTPLKRFDDKPTAAIVSELLGTTVSKETLTAIEIGLQNIQSNRATVASLAIASPDFQRR